MAFGLVFAASAGARSALRGGRAGTDLSPVPPAPNLSTPARWHRLAVALLAGLVFCEGLWELTLAPLRPGGSWLALKVVPLAWVWFSLARGKRRARQLASLMLPLFAAEGIVRAMTESGRHAYVAAVTAALALAALAAILLSFRAEEKEKQGQT